ncbi:hypothetical protein [Klebsiella pneumoniae IS46]|uniref:Uncharacterized protein n=1 Tax=Klebsiella pneumoniae IS43 TaxID=1432552 RepID=W1DEG8_KLEPN|nr:cys regulon transcriptional activator CysB domain protein [Klebsiella pneumoniae]CDL07788.1 hypothetical protein [Klebsiella pneumoniae IS43]CDL13827.1 hypothetical protein [Klebsiella pneumoniae IS46]BBE56245.1 hypothetical protein TRKP33_2824 [Klebsiella pneumoniae]BBE61925.1 hypothetical protein TRKP064_2831 [Klebsiella pneumoniae]
MPFLLLKRLIHHRFQDALRRHYGQLPGAQGLHRRQVA